MRLKIIAGNLAVVVLLGLFSYFMVRGDLRAALAAEVDGGIANDQVLFDRSFQLSAHDFVRNVAERAQARPVEDVFAGLDEDSRRTRAFEAAQSAVAWLGDPARGRRGAPDIVVVVDDAGKTIARNGARNVMFGRSLIASLPTLAEVLKDGTARYDVWREEQENKLLETAVAAIRNDQGSILGALVVGYDLSNGLASREGALLRREIAFVADGQVYSSSMQSNRALVKELGDFLFGPQKSATDAVLKGEVAAAPAWTVVLGGVEFIGVTAHLPMSPSQNLGYAVLGNRTAKMALAAKADVILYTVVLAALLVFGYGFVLGGALLRPIEQIEEGVLMIINGQTDHRLETDSPELGGLAYRINQLLNVFTGTEEDTGDEQGRVSVAPTDGHWKDAAFSDGGGASGGGGGDEVIDDAELAAKLAGEDEQAYYARIHREYAAAKQALGESVANIPVDRFAQRLVGRAEALTKQHACRMVRFQVQTRDNQVVLRPVIIR